MTKDDCTKLYVKYTTLLGAALCIVNWYYIPLALILGLFVNLLGHSIGYHRLFTHRSFKPKYEWIGKVLILLGSVTGRGSPIGYAAIHNTHHVYSDTDKDPHSPNGENFFKFFMKHFDLQPDRRVTIKTMRTHTDSFSKYVHQHLLELNVITLLITLVFGFANVYLMSVFVALLIGVSINYFGHKDLTPTNKLWLGILTLGEGFHASHHRNPMHSQFHKYDVGGYICKWISA
jgi:stearoyl-CoA desaturase (delta-9 desaturase)